MLLNAKLRLAFSTRTSASAMARSMSSMLSGSCEKHVPVFDTDGPISECIVCHSITLAGWPTASTLSSTTKMPAPAGPSLTLMWDDEDTVSGAAMCCTSAGMLNAVSNAPCTARSKDMLSRPESSIKSEVKRFLLNPAQATTYKIGMIAIQKLRDEARAELGDKFDWKAFHDTVITGGSLPLPVLETRVRTWIAKVKAG